MLEGSGKRTTASRETGNKNYFYPFINTYEFNENLFLPVYEVNENYFFYFIKVMKISFYKGNENYFYYIINTQ